MKNRFEQQHCGACAIRVEQIRMYFFGKMIINGLHDTFYILAIFRCDLLIWNFYSNDKLVTVFHYYTYWITSFVPKFANALLKFHFLFQIAYLLFP